MSSLMSSWEGKKTLSVHRSFQGRKPNALAQDKASLLNHSQGSHLNQSNCPICPGCALPREGAWGVDCGPQQWRDNPLPALPLCPCCLFPRGSLFSLPSLGDGGRNGPAAPALTSNKWSWEPGLTTQLGSGGKAPEMS